MLNLSFFLPFSLHGLGFSHGYSYPNGSLLVDLTDNRFTCLANAVKFEIRDDSHHN